MSLLSYFAPITGATESDLDSDSESIESVDPQSSSTVLDSQLSSDSSSIIASAAESGSENDTSITLPVDSHTRNVRICQGPHQPRLSKFKVTVHNGKARSFCSKWYDMYKWLEYSPKVDKMYCFTCRVFALKVPRNVGRVDPAFTTSRTQAHRWKNARSALFKHQNSAVHKQAGLLQLEYHSITPVNLQLDKLLLIIDPRLNNSKKRTDRFFIVLLMLL